MDTSDLPDGFFTTNGTDIWEIQGCFLTPSCTMVNLKTGEKQNFGMQGRTAQDFHKIKLPIEPKETPNDNQG